MSDIPPRHPNHRPNQQTRPFDYEGDRAFVAEWLAHLAAGRVGGSLCRPTAALLEARNPPMSDEARAAILANERVVMGPRRGGGR